MKKVFIDSFVMHDESDFDPYISARKEIKRVNRCAYVIGEPPKGNELLLKDTRKELHVRIRLLHRENFFTF